MPKHNNVIQFSLPLEYREKLESLAKEGESIGVCSKRILMQALDGHIDPLAHPDIEARLSQMDQRFAQLEAKMEEPDILAKMEAIALFNKFEKQAPELFSPNAKEEDIRKYFLKESIKVWSELRRLGEKVEGMAQNSEPDPTPESIAPNPPQENKTTEDELTLEKAYQKIQEWRTPSKGKRKLTVNQIAKRLNIMGYPCTEDKSEWSPDMVTNYLKRIGY